MPKGTLRVCPRGHRFLKSSDCPTCPVCEQERKPDAGFLSLISSPARRALESKKITTLRQLSKYSEQEILALHGMGPAAVKILRKVLKEESLSFLKK